jgi:peroxiredoxin Q/BCP
VTKPRTSTFPQVAVSDLDLEISKVRRWSCTSIQRTTHLAALRKPVPFRRISRYSVKKGAVVIGVSADSVASHAKFAEKYDLAFPLLSDESKDIIKSYAVWKEKSMYGKKYMGIERTTFIIDEQGVITHIFPKVKVEGHTEEILKAL